MNDSATEIRWAELYDESANRLTLPPNQTVKIVDAASPLVEDAEAPIPFGAPSGPTLKPQPVLMDVPPEVESIHLKLEGDLVLDLEGQELDINVSVRSVGDPPWIAITNGVIARLSASATNVGGARRWEGDRATSVAISTRVGLLDCVGADAVDSVLGWVQARTISATGQRKLRIVDLPGTGPVGVQTQDLTVESRCVDVESYLSADRIARKTTITCQDEGVLTLGGVGLGVAESKYLAVAGGTVRIRCGAVFSLALQDVQRLEVGEPRPPDKSEALHGIASDAVASESGYGLAAYVVGHVDVLVLGHRAVIAGRPDVGFSARRVEAAESAEISGLDADGFNHGSAAVLRSVRRLGLWVNPSTRAARRRFQSEVERRSFEDDPALFDLAHKRKHLLHLATDTMQDGHTLSVLREAEKDARRASLPWQSRERVLLELWRRMLGYGERIGYPLLVGSTLILLLGITKIGWRRAFSADWWSGWSSARMNNIVSFALPGVDILGLNGVGGLLGVAAKAVSVVFIGSAIAIAVRVVRRGE